MASKKKGPGTALFPDGFWDRPAESKIGDADQDSIFVEVGRALTRWERVEERLASLAIVLADIRDSKASQGTARLWGSIESSAGRRDALRSLAEVYFWPDWDKYKSKFNQLMDYCSRGSKLRDDIAHGKVIQISSPDGSKPFGSFLFPSQYNTGCNILFPELDGIDNWSFQILRSKYRYTSKDINLIGRKFDALLIDITNYMSSIIKKDGQLPTP
jgi:hypothetical protein